MIGPYRIKQEWIKSNISQTIIFLSVNNLTRTIVNQIKSELATF